MADQIPQLPSLPSIPGLPAGSNVDLQQVYSDISAPYGNNPFPMTESNSTKPSTGITSYVQKKASSSSFFLEDIVVIIVGIILIAAGVFAFKSTQTVIETVGKAASKAGELTA